MNFGKLFKLVLSLAPGTRQSATMFIGVSTGSRLDSGRFKCFLKGLSNCYVCVHTVNLSKSVCCARDLCKSFETRTLRRLLESLGGGVPLELTIVLSFALTRK